MVRYAIVAAVFVLGGVAAGGAVTAVLADGPGEGERPPVSQHMQDMGAGHAEAHAQMHGDCEALVGEGGSHPPMQ